MKSQEFSRRALNLSLAVYRVTANFPEGEVLAQQLRALANEIAGDLAENNPVAAEKKIERLSLYFAIAKVQGWVKAMNWSILEFEYYKLRQEVVFRPQSDEGPLVQKARAEESPLTKEEGANIVSHNIRSLQKEVKKSPRQHTAGLPLRQDRILKIIKNKEFVKMSDLTPLFKNDISERTLRNELQELVGSGLVKKRGANKYTEYYVR